MVEYQHQEKTALDATFGALADPTRRAIFAALGEGEKRVTEVAAPFDMSLNAVSKHIKKLEAAGLVRRRRDGRDHFLEADPTPLKEAATWVEQAQRRWNARLDRLEALLAKEEEVKT